MKTSNQQRKLACIVTVDERHASTIFRATARWCIADKIKARASCTSGPLQAALRCAAKLFGLTDPSIDQLEAEMVLQEVTGYDKLRPGFRQWIVTLKGKGAAS